MGNYICFNFVVGLAYMVFKLQIVSFDMIVWLFSNIFNMPIIILGEFWADYSIQRNSKKLWGTKAYIESFGLIGGHKYLILQFLYFVSLFFIINSALELELEIYIIVILFLVYHFLNVGSFLYRLARIKFWWSICLVSYFIAAIIYYETPIKNNFENKTLYKKEESNFIDKISIDEKKEIKNILVNTALEMNNISNSSIPIKEKIKILTDYDITYHSKINNSNLKPRTKKILINQKEVFNSMKEMNFAVAYTNEAFNTLDSSYIDLAADYYKKYSFGKLDSELEEFIKIAKSSIEDIKLNRFTEEKYQQLSDSYKRIQNKAYELSDGVWD